MSVLQYQRTSNFQDKNNIEEVNHSRNLRFQQRKFLLNTQQYQTNLNTNLQQKDIIYNPLQRILNKNHKTQIHISDEFGVNNIIAADTKKTKELQIQQKDIETNNEKIVNNRVSKCKSNSYQKLQVLYRKHETSQCKSPDNELSNDDHTCSEYPLSLDIGNSTGCKISNLPEVGDRSKMEKERNIEKGNNLYDAHTVVASFDDIDGKSVESVREKTPMCRINDLARFNKIPFQYRLTSENGPAHCKRFTVTLKLGDEEYTAEEFKIKKAQHLAANEAIEKTKYQHPTPKTNRRNDDNNMKSNITPTVELNALAMKLGQQTYYIFDPREMALNEKSFTQNNTPKTSKLFSPNSIVQHHVATVDNYVGTFVPNLINNTEVIRAVRPKLQFLSKSQYSVSQFKCSLGHVPNSNSVVSSHFNTTSPCRITLIVGTKKFLGVGRTLQQAKHNAAFNALQVLKQQIKADQIEIHNECLNDIDNKSPISLVFEIGIKRNLRVHFKVLREEGPAHMRTFITACAVGAIITEGKGTGKKTSKNNAAQKMLEELKKLTPLSPFSSPTNRVKLKTPDKKSVCALPKSINLLNYNETKHHCNKNIKVINETDSPNPIIKLLDWHQSKKEKIPTFKLINEHGNGNSRRRQFAMEVSSNNIVARGVGNSKKLAKRDAAKNFLIAISESDQITLSESADLLRKTEPEVNADNETNNYVLSSDTFSHIQRVNKAGQILELNTETSNKPERVKKGTLNSTYCSNKSSKDSLICSSLTKTLSKSHNLYMKDQLLYLANLLDFEVDFSDYPKGNHNEFLTIVMISTKPPQICHGVGTDAKESQEDAAKNALKILSEMGLNNAVKPT